MGSLLVRLARSSDRGAELIEYALIVPLLMLVLLGIAEFGLFFQAFSVVSNAAREGARMGVLARETDATYYSAADIQARVASFISTGLPAAAATPTTTVACESQSWGGGPAFYVGKVTVNYTYTFQFIGPIASLFGRSFASVPMTAVSTMRRELQACP